MNLAVRLREATERSAALLRNSGALIVAAAVTAVCGFAYWWLAARAFPPEAIGRAAAVLSVMGLLGLLGDAGLGTLLIGELGRYRDRGAGLVGASAVVGVCCSAALALLFLLCVPLLGHAPLIEGTLKVLMFVAGSSLTAFTMVVSQAFLGMLNGTARMLHQVLFSAFKLALVCGVAAAGAVGDGAILFSWVGALAVSWIGVDLATGGSARRLLGLPDFRLLHSLRRKVFDHYALDVALQAPGLVVPYLVAVLLTPTTNAAFATIWMLIAMAAVVPSVLATVLFPVVREGPADFRRHFMLSLGVSMLFSLGCAVFVLIYSRQILGVFNPAYADIAGSSLQFLGFSLLGSTLKFHACTLARLNDTMRRASFWFMLGGVLELVFAVAGAKLHGLAGLVAGWTAAVLIEGALMALLWGNSSRRGRHAARDDMPPAEGHRHAEFATATQD